MSVAIAEVRRGHVDSGSAAKQWRPYVAVGVLAALMSAIAFMASGMLRGTYPFGPVSRSINDLGTQIIPMHTEFRDILTGQSPGDFFLNWNSGFGVQFVADFMVYIGTGLSWIIMLFPRDQIDLAIYAITVVAIALASTAMAIYLRRLRPDGPLWLAAVAGASYGTCAWAIDDAAYFTVWLNGLVAFPVLCLLGEWILTKRTILPLIVSPLPVALLWTSNFYTVYMATLGAGIVFLARILSLERCHSWKYRLSSVVRYGAALLLGIGLAAALLVPTLRAIQASRPSPDVIFQPQNWVDFFSRLQAGTEGVGSSPGLAVGTLMLLLALSLPFNRLVPVRERAVWTVTAMLTLLSMQVGLTHIVWHGFDPPNGSPFRQAFVVAGMVVILGWLSATKGVRNVVAVVAPVALVAGLYILAYDSRHVTPTTRFAVPAVLAALLIMGLLLRWTSRSGRHQLYRVGIILVLLIVGAEATASATAIDKARAEILGTSPVWGDEHNEVQSLIISSDDWPSHRTDPDWHFTANDPMLVGGQGAEYYSNTVPDVLSQTLTAFGYGYTSYGRGNIDPANPVVDAVFSTASRVVRVDEDATVSGERFRLERHDVPPLVTFRRGMSWQSNDPEPFGPQETALGYDVYEVPPMSAPAISGLNISGRRQGDLVITATSKAEFPAELHFTGTCRPGSEAFLSGPSLVGEARLDGGPWVPMLSQMARRPGVYTGMPMRSLGMVGADGTVDVTVRIPGPTRLPTFPIGCLDHQGLDEAINALSASAPTQTDITGHGVDVTLPGGGSGTVVLGAVRVPGWQCVVDDAPPKTPNSLAGLIAVPVDGDASEVSCAFRPRGLRMGLGIGGASLIVVLALAGWARFRWPHEEDQRH